MSGTGGKVALVNSTTSLGCNGGSTPCSAAQLAMIIDLVGGTEPIFMKQLPRQRQLLPLPLFVATADVLKQTITALIFRCLHQPEKFRVNFPLLQRPYQSKRNWIGNSEHLVRE
jgi:hypothetical protein